MALATEQERVVKEIAALCTPQDQETLARILTDNQAVREGFLRQSDYDRKLNEHKQEIEAKREELTSSIRKYETLHQDNVDWRDEHKATLDKGLQFDQMKATLEQKIAEATTRANAGGEGEMKPEEVKAEIDRQIKAMGLDPSKLSAEAMTQMVNQVVTSMVEKERNDFLSVTMPLQAKFNVELNRLDRQHEKEFAGAPLDLQEFAAFCGQHVEEKDLNKQYENYVKPKRELEATKKQLQDENAAALEAERKKLQQQFGSAALPGSGALPEEIGPMQRRVQEARKLPETAAVIPGGAAAAAAELRTAGKF